MSESAESRGNFEKNLDRASCGQQQTQGEGLGVLAREVREEPLQKEGICKRASLSCSKQSFMSDKQ